MVKIKKAIVLLLLTLQADLYAQCAMCKAAVESSEGEDGFNDAIIFLMMIPYVIGLIAIIFFIYYKRKRKESTKL